MRWAAAGLAVLASVLGVVGTFLHAVEIRESLTPSTGEYRYVVTGWSTESTGPGVSDIHPATPLVGLPVVLGAVLLVVAAVLLVFRRGSWTAAAGGTLLAATVAMTWIYLLPAKYNFEQSESRLGDVAGSWSYTIEPGTWLLLVAGVLGLAVVALSPFTGRTPDPVPSPAPGPWGSPLYGSPPYGAPSYPPAPAPPGYPHSVPPPPAQPRG